MYLVAASSFSKFIVPSNLPSCSSLRSSADEQSISIRRIVYSRSLPSRGRFLMNDLRVVIAHKMDKCHFGIYDGNLISELYHSKAFNQTQSVPDVRVVAILSSLIPLHVRVSPKKTKTKNALERSSSWVKTSATSNQNAFQRSVSFWISRRNCFKISSLENEGSFFNASLNVDRDDNDQYQL